MAFKLIDIATPEDRVAAIKAIAEEWRVADVRVGNPLEDGRHPIALLVADVDRQKFLDRLQAALGKSENWRIAVQPIDTIVPDAAGKEPEEPKDAVETVQKEDSERASREELYHLVEGGARMDSNFLLLVLLSTVVATVGLEMDSVAVLIGAMAIAPLLGPNIAFAFGAAIGDRALMATASKSSVVGILLSILAATGLALLSAGNAMSRELLTRTSVDYAGIALALASGAAAALSVTTGLSSTLVGVMVAVALLPPAATIGIMLASGRADLALGAAMLLIANVACVNLAAQVVFLAKGIKPRTWAERKTARRAIAVNLITWIILIGILISVIALHRRNPWREGETRS